MSAEFDSFAADRVVIMAAPNGARRSQADHPALPVTPGELAENAVALRNAGVAVLHLHVRDESGRHTLDADRYRDAISAIRERVGNDLIIQVTTEAVGMYTAGEQMAVVRDLRPEAVSLALREICPAAGDEKEASAFFAWMQQQEIWPQFILYSADDVVRFNDMRRRGVFDSDAPFALFVLGNYADGTPGKVEDLELLLAAMDVGAYPWAVCCFGPGEHVVMLAAAAVGGHVRIGFENNVALRNGELAPDNAALIDEFTQAIAMGARRPATVADVRAAFIKVWLF